MADQTTQQPADQTATAAAPDAAPRSPLEISVLGPFSGGMMKALLAGAAREGSCGEGCNCGKEKKRTLRAPSLQELTAHMEALAAYTPEQGDLVRLNPFALKVLETFPGGATEARIGRVLPSVMFEQEASVGRSYTKHAFDCTIVLHSTVEVDGKVDSGLVEVFFHSEMLELVPESQDEPAAE